MMRSSLPARHRALLLAVALVSAVTASCSNHRSLDVTAKRENLDLVYKKAELAKKAPTLQQVIDAAPAVSGLPANAAALAQPAGPGADAGFRSPPPAPSCPAAPRGTPASSLATTATDNAPAVGRYPAHQTGTFAVQAGTLNVQGPVPPQVEIRIANVVDTSTTNAGGNRQANVTFDQIEPGLNRPTVTTYRITPTELDLVKIVSDAGTFQPSPAITIMQFKDAAGTSWTAAGVDLDTTEAMTVQGTIVAREVVDLCGKVVEAYRISSDERRVNPQTHSSYATDSSQPKIYDIATQAGGLTIRIREKSTTSFVINGTPATVSVDYTRTLDALQPSGSR